MAKRSFLPGPSLCVQYTLVYLRLATTPELSVIRGSLRRPTCWTPGATSNGNFRSAAPQPVNAASTGTHLERFARTRSRLLALERQSRAGVSPARAERSEANEALSARLALTCSLGRRDACPTLPRCRFTYALRLEVSGNPLAGGNCVGQLFTLLFACQQSNSTGRFMLQSLDVAAPQTMQTPSAARTELSVAGMTCSGCARTVTDALQAVPGVASAAVSLETKSASERWN